MSITFIKLSRLFNQTKHFMNITPLRCNILSFLRISRLQSTYKTFPVANYNRFCSGSHGKVSPFLYWESFIPISQMTLLNRCQSCYYSSSSTNNGSDDYNDSFKEFDNDPEIQSLLQNIKDDFKVFTNEDLDENNVTVSENVNSKAKRLYDSNVIRFESESDSGSSEESDDSDIEDFLDSGFMADDTEIEEFEIPQYVPPIELKRGKTGVFDLDELVTVLNEENARDLCVISVPAHINYVDYLVLVNGISPRHIKAMAELMKWLVILPSTYFFHTFVNCMTSRPYGLSELNTTTSAKRLKRNTSYQTQACSL
ncbi:uncharacterized protein LOC106873318 isoform X2 [Octopus bimaculoides]|uniref:Uncharacterized protein n=1 Tax=Octopus bimaculoides TaxID=37653 RepID=A0A0L8H390_OCTBM|nr:uncharacterized protein LOC106873318 isoform X2 [Octopus bimaculoides]|eukprot:XP_014776128.1 PREDICTED: uncharacterized protein LOC106873318 isoform X2 [Octopus bimaculoides]